MNWSRNFNIIPFKQPTPQSIICPFNPCENFSCQLTHPYRNPSKKDIDMSDITKKQINKPKSKPKKKIKNNKSSVSKSSNNNNNNNNINMEYIEVIRQEQDNYFNNNKSEKEAVKKVLHFHDNATNNNNIHTQTNIQTQHVQHNYPPRRTIDLEAVKDLNNEQFSRYKELWKDLVQSDQKNNDQ